MKTEKVKEKAGEVATNTAINIVFEPLTGMKFSIFKLFFGWWGEAKAKSDQQRIEAMRRAGIEPSKHSEEFIPPMHRFKY
jgi:hypothetical protein